MDFLHAIQWGYAFSGLIVGLLVGFTGVGGGSLMTPLLVLMFGVHPATAVGTDLLYAGISRSVGTAVHGAQGTVDWPIVGKLAAGSLPATALTLLVMSRFPAHLEAGAGHGHSVITSVLGFALILTAIAILFRRLILKAIGERMEATPPRVRTALTVILGAVLGVLVSVSSVGAGAIGVTVLLALYPSMPAAKLVGSDIAHAVPLALLAGVGHWAMGMVDFHLLWSLLVGSIPGIIVGSLFASRTSDSILRPVLASTLALVGGKLLF